MSLLSTLNLPSNDHERELIANNSLIMEALLSALGIESSLSEIVKVATVVAEVAKLERARSKLSPFIPKLASLCLLSLCHHIDAADVYSFIPKSNVDKFVNHPEPELVAAAIQFLRAFANLCYDHEKNRDVLFECKPSIQFIIDCATSPDLNVLQTAYGCLLNVSMDNEPIQVELISLSAFPKLTKIIKEGISTYKYRRLSLLGLNVLSNLCETDLGIDTLVIPDATNSIPLAFLIGLIKTFHAKILAENEEGDDVEFDEHIEFLDVVLGILESVSEQDKIQRAIQVNGLLSTLLEFVNETSFRVDRDDNEKGDDDEEEKVDLKQLQKRVAKIISLVTMNDQNMIELTSSPDTINILKNWMHRGYDNPLKRTDDEIRMYGALSLGNLCRSDATCGILATPPNEIIPALLTMIIFELERLKDFHNAVAELNGGSSGEVGNEAKRIMKIEIKSIVQLLHAGIGALKNLSLCVMARDALSKSDIIDVLTRLLQMDGTKPIQASAVSILKNLCGGNNMHTIYKILTNQIADSQKYPLPSTPLSDTPLSIIILRIWNSIADNEVAIRNEGGRFISNIVRTLHYEKFPTLLQIIIDNNGVVLLLQIITGATLTREAETMLALNDGRFVDNTNVGANNVESRVFPVVQNEGIVASILLCAAHPNVAHQIVRYSVSLLHSLLLIIKNGHDSSTIATNITVITSDNEYPDQIKVNACLLLETLSRADADFRQKVSKEKSDFVEIMNQNRAGDVAENVLEIGVGALSFEKALGRVVELISS